MPKLRTSIESYMDAQRHITIGRSRMPTDTYNQTIGGYLDTIMTLMTKVIAYCEKEEKSLLNKDLHSAINLYKKELKKNDTVIDWNRAVRDICSATNTQKALKIGLHYGIERDQVILMMKDAPPETNLGKALLALKPETTQQIPIEPPAVTAPLVFEQDAQQEEEDTIDNDSEMDDKLKKLLAGE